MILGDCVYIWCKSPGEKIEMGSQVEWRVYSYKSESQIVRESYKSICEWNNFHFVVKFCLCNEPSQVIYEGN